MLLVVSMVPQPNYHDREGVLAVESVVADVLEPLDIFLAAKMQGFGYNLLAFRYKSDPRFPLQ